MHELYKPIKLHELKMLIRNDISFELIVSSLLLYNNNCHLLLEIKLEVVEKYDKYIDDIIVNNIEQNNLTRALQILNIYGAIFKKVNIKSQRMLEILYMIYQIYFMQNNLEKVKYYSIIILDQYKEFVNCNDATLFLQKVEVLKKKLNNNIFNLNELLNT
jgi:hypothetical protein